MDSHSFRPLLARRATLLYVIIFPPKKISIIEHHLIIVALTITFNLRISQVERIVK